jgi:hypothetical protein
MFHDNDPNDPPGSPLMKPINPKFTKQSPTPKPPANTPPPTFRSDDEDVGPGRPRFVQSPNEAFLLQHLDGGRHMYIGRPIKEEPESDGSDGKGKPPLLRAELPSLVQLPDQGVTSQLPPTTVKPVPNELERLAERALAVAGPQQAPADCPLTTSTRKLSIQEGTPHMPAIISTSANQYQPEPTTNAKSPQLLTPGSTGSAGLPPISPGGSEPAAQTLPPLRFHLPDVKLPLPDQDLATRHHAPSSFTQSPPDSHQLPPLTIGRVSPQPPLSPPESYPRSHHSPSFVPSPYAHIPNGGPHRPSADFGARPPAEMPSHDPVPFASSVVQAPVDRMRIDGITNPQMGGYVCTFSGCNAPPFQTQYLLNSHANVHSSARPHYCPVPGCSRSEGGKGFKRKNEMIRHGLVHDSPGYICPFCPDRDHRYPRPDNLQRFVPRTRRPVLGFTKTNVPQGMFECIMSIKAKTTRSSGKSYPNVRKGRIVAAEDEAGRPEILMVVRCA